MDGDSVMDVMYRRGSTSTSDLERLLKRGEDPNHCDATKRSLLALCVGDILEDSQRLRKAELLIQYGADVDAQDVGGWTVAHMCAWSRDMPYLELLAKHGADFAIKNCDKSTPSDLAFMKGYTEVCDFLDRRTLSLRAKCRSTVRAALGRRRSYSGVNRLPVPSSVKLFINYGTPYPGWEAVSVPEEPWTHEELEGGTVQLEELCKFIQTHAEEEFLAKYEVPNATGGITTDQVQIDNTADKEQGSCSDLYSSMIEAYQNMYITESFKKVDYTEPVARETRLGKQRYGVVGSAEIDNGALDFLLPNTLRGVVS